MLKNPKQLDAFHSRLYRQEVLTYQESVRIFEALLNEAVLLGAINSKNILDGIDVDIRIANAVNRVGSCSKPC
jgi:hypothetical protein